MATSKGRTKVAKAGRTAPRAFHDKRFPGESGTYRRSRNRLLKAEIGPLWNLPDLTPEGRGKDWYPQLTYSS